jgi:hypothetical protein
VERYLVQHRIEVGPNAPTRSVSEDTSETSLTLRFGFV